MRVTNLVSTALLLLSELNAASAKAVIYMPKSVRRRGQLDDEMRKTAMDLVKDRIRRREPQSVSTTPLTASTSTALMNATIASACTTALSGVDQVTNEAGIMACYNVLQYDSTQGTFAADLRLYQPGQTSGSFAQISLDDMTISIVFPSSTNFQQSLLKRSVTHLAPRQQNMSEVQQYSLMGNFLKSIDVSKLNSTQIMSLLVPTISINALDPTSQTPVSTNVTSADMAYFVVGEFKGEFTSGAVSPAAQAAAIAASSAFVLPGTKLGMFPVGLIVTSAWMVLFVAAFGVGTLGRIRHRNIYRRRKAATAGRTGKRF